MSHSWVPNYPPKPPKLGPQQANDHHDTADSGLPAQFWAHSQQDCTNLSFGTRLGQTSVILVIFSRPNPRASDLSVSKTRKRVQTRAKPMASLDCAMASRTEPSAEAGTIHHEPATRGAHREEGNESEAGTTSIGQSHGFQAGPLPYWILYSPA